MTGTFPNHQEMQRLCTIKWWARNVLW